MRWVASEVYLLVALLENPSIMPLGIFFVVHTSGGICIVLCVAFFLLFICVFFFSDYFS